MRIFVSVILLPFTCFTSELSTVACKPLHCCLDLKGGSAEIAAQTVTGSGTAGSADEIPKKLTSRMLGMGPAYESKTELLC